MFLLAAMVGGVGLKKKIERVLIILFVTCHNTATIRFYKTTLRYATIIKQKVV
jgi:hypothetical protein